MLVCRTWGGEGGQSGQLTAADGRNCWCWSVEPEEGEGRSEWTADCSRREELLLLVCRTWGGEGGQSGQLTAADGRNCWCWSVEPEEGEGRSEWTADCNRREELLVLVCRTWGGEGRSEWTADCSRREELLVLVCRT